MTVKQWILLIVLCAGVYFIPGYLPVLDGGEYYLHQGSWSLLAAFVALRIYHGPATIAIASIEALSIFLAGMTYQSAPAHPEFLDLYYNIVNSLACIEALILLLGAPWGGIFRFARELGVSDSDRNTARNRGLAHRRNDNQVSQ